MSPLPGGSTLITRAPKSASSVDANGPARAWERSSTVMSRSEEHTSELQSQSNLVCRLLLEKKKKTVRTREQRDASDHVCRETCGRSETNLLHRRQSCTCHRCLASSSCVSMCTRYRCGYTL